MNLLTIDTASNACSAALLSDTATFEEFEIAPRQHTELLIPMIDSVLTRAGVARSQLDAIAFVAGPGSFTGIRIATSVAQGMSLGLNIPVISLSSLLVLASSAKNALDTDEIFPCLDARRGQVYWAHYSFADNYPEPKCIIEDCLSPIEQMRLAMPEAAVAWGTGLEDSKDAAEHYPRAVDGLAIAKARFENKQFDNPGEAQAVYFRRGV